ncbi:hypothetical protein [Nocardia sp. BMG111209]|uniref:hypothetical protein n=1 Tax=Nocardia sp. BMG111209 TaxID=1160137 RepID=UPI000378BF34|nr:hypothetical protein [Nocardia sp. BMG111209]
MATASMMIADPAKLHTGAQDTSICLGELETYLRTLAASQSGLQSAVQSPATGAAIQRSLSDAGTAGTKLANTLNDIVNALRTAGVKIDDQDLQGAAKVYEHAGGDGKVDTNF